MALGGHRVFSQQMSLLPARTFHCSQQEVSTSCSQWVVAACVPAAWCRSVLGASEESDEEGIWMVNRLIAINHKHKQGSQSRPAVQSLRAQSVFSQHAWGCSIRASPLPPPPRAVAKIIKPVNGWASNCVVSLHTHDSSQLFSQVLHCISLRYQGIL